MNVRMLLGGFPSVPGMFCPFVIYVLNYLRQETLLIALVKIACSFLSYFLFPSMSLCFLGCPPAGTLPPVELDGCMTLVSGGP